MTASASSALQVVEALTDQLVRSLEETRSAWPDGARRSFDATHAAPIVDSARRVTTEMKATAERIDWLLAQISR